MSEAKHTPGEMMYFAAQARRIAERQREIGYTLSATQADNAAAWWTAKAEGRAE